MSFETPEQERIDRSPEHEAAINTCGSFDELYEILRGIGEVTGSHGEIMRAEDIIAIIEVLRKTQGVPRAITNTHGIRDKIQELLLKEQGGQG